MGTNFYWKASEDKKAETLHIGKSSIGWCFGLHVIPEKGINTLQDWSLLFRFGKIRDEYGTEITREEMLETIASRSREGPITEYVKTQVRAIAEAEKCFVGPRWLLRRRITENHCIGHGEGTWDYVLGDFF